MRIAVTGDQNFDDAQQLWQIMLRIPFEFRGFIISSEDTLLNHTVKLIADRLDYPVFIHDKFPLHGTTGLLVIGNMTPVARIAKPFFDHHLPVYHVKFKRKSDETIPSSPPPLELPTSAPT